MPKPWNGDRHVEKMALESAHPGNGNGRGNGKGESSKPSTSKKPGLCLFPEKVLREYGIDPKTVVQ